MFSFLVWVKRSSTARGRPGSQQEGLLPQHHQVDARPLELVRIPIYSGRVFRREAGRGSDLKPASIPR